MSAFKISLLGGLCLLAACKPPAAEAQGGAGTLEPLTTPTGQLITSALTGNPVSTLSAPIRAAVAVAAMACRGNGNQA
jgi:hypothetical protein